jgi:hypothetical protein
MNKQETWVEKRQIQNEKDSHNTRCQIMWQLFLFSYQQRNCSVLLSLSLCACAVVLCTPKRISLYFFSSRSCCSLAFYQLHQHIKFKNSKYTFYFTILYYYCEVTLFREIGASAYRINRERVITDRTLLFFHIWIANIIHYFSFTVKNKFYSFKC